MLVLQGSLGNEYAERGHFEVLFPLGKGSTVGNVH